MHVSAPPASSVTVTAGQRAQAERPAERTREVTTLGAGASANTPVRRQGPGGSLPEPDAGHPLHGAGGHAEVCTRPRHYGRAPGVSPRCPRTARPAPGGPLPAMLRGADGPGGALDDHKFTVASMISRLLGRMFPELARPPLRDRGATCGAAVRPVWGACRRPRERARQRGRTGRNERAAVRMSRRYHSGCGPCCARAVHRRAG